MTLLFLNTVVNLLLSVPTDDINLNDIVGVGGVAIMLWLVFFFKNLKGQIYIRIKAGHSKDKDDDSSSAG